MLHKMLPHWIVDLVVSDYQLSVGSGSTCTYVCESEGECMHVCEREGEYMYVRTYVRVRGSTCMYVRTYVRVRGST